MREITRSTSDGGNYVFPAACPSDKKVSPLLSSRHLSPLWSHDRGLTSGSDGGHIGKRQYPCDAPKWRLCGPDWNSNHAQQCGHFLELTWTLVLSDMDIKNKGHKMGYPLYSTCEMRAFYSQHGTSPVEGQGILQFLNFNMQYGDAPSKVPCNDMLGVGLLRQELWNLSDGHIVPRIFQ